MIKIGALMSLLLAGSMSISGLGDLGTKYFDTDNAVVNDLSADDSSTMRKSYWANGGCFDCDFNAGNISFKYDAMTLKLGRAASGSDYKYSGAEYATRENYGYGLYTVSMKPAKNNGVISSFFTYTGPSEGNRWDEIDIEFLGKDTTKVQFTLFADGVSSKGYTYDLGFDASENYHEYGYLWMEDRVSWIVDGEIVYTLTEDDCEIPYVAGKIMMNIWNGNSNLKNWSGTYNGKSSYAHYDYFSYVPLEEMKFVNVYYGQKKYIDISSGWTNDDDQYAITNNSSSVKIERTAAQNKAYSYVEYTLDEPINNPKNIRMALKASHGTYLSISVSVVDEKGNNHYLDNFTCKNDYETHEVDFPIEEEYGRITKVRMYINSDKNAISVTKYSRITLWASNIIINN